MPLLLVYLLTIICVGLLSGGMAVIFRRHYKVFTPPLIIIPVLYSLFLLLSFGPTTLLLKGIILCLVLVYAAGVDIRTHEVPDYIPIMVVLAALIATELPSLPSMCLSALLITIPQLAAAIWKPGSYGGADIKLMAALGFCLGLHKGIAALLIGLGLGAICVSIYRKIKKRPINTPFPLVPFLAIGSCITYLV